MQNTSLGEFTDVGVDRIADVETELFGLTGHQALLKRLRVEVASDEHEATFPLFAFFPKADFFAEFTKGRILKCWDEGNPYRVEIQNDEKTNVWVPIDNDNYVRKGV